jgi:hypothetical protein
MPAGFNLTGYTRLSIKKARTKNRDPFEAAPSRLGNNFIRDMYPGNGRASLNKVKSLVNGIVRTNQQFGSSPNQPCRWVNQ